VEKIETDVLVIGAGVVGLAIAERLGRSRHVILVEAYPQFGRETSSRNSEVIHSGIYYPPTSNKTKWCIEGREALYDFCRRHHIAHAAIGKFVVATESTDQGYLQKLAEHCRALEVPCERWTQSQLAGAEPLLRVREGLYLPRTGIVDSHQFMARLEQLFADAGGLLAYRHRVTALMRSQAEWKASVTGPEGTLEISAPRVINAAGLAAAEISNQALQTSRFQHKFCRGRYFALPPRYQKKFNRLIYPVPPQDGLGIHVTLDLQGFAKLGPDVDWAEAQSYAETPALYDCDWDALRPTFAQAARRYCPTIHEEDLRPGLVGIRPKLFVDGKQVGDFIVENHSGFIHCLGIESPGLTASLAIADEVERLS
jgi:2-hydroxyglutarate dehydrogenase